MRERPVQKKVLTVRSRRANDKEAEVLVADSGAGIDARGRSPGSSTRSFPLSVAPLPSREPVR